MLHVNFLATCLKGGRNSASALDPEKRLTISSLERFRSLSGGPLLKGLSPPLIMRASAPLNKELVAENKDSFEFFRLEGPLRLHRLALASHGGRQQTCEQVEDQKRLQCVPNLLPRKS
jgi:hypothetical protein